MAKEYQREALSISKSEMINKIHFATGLIQYMARFINPQLQVSRYSECISGIQKLHN